MLGPNPNFRLLRYSYHLLSTSSHPNAEWSASEDAVENLLLAAASSGGEGDSEEDVADVLQA